MGQFRCLNCRTVPMPGHRFCYACGAPFPGPVPEAAVRPPAEAESHVDLRRSGMALAGLSGAILLGVAKTLIFSARDSWPLGALCLIGGIAALSWAAQGNSDDGGSSVLGVLRTTLIYLLLALGVGVGLIILVLGMCFTLIGAAK